MMTATDEGHGRQSHEDFNDPWVLVRILGRSLKGMLDFVITRIVGDRTHTTHYVLIALLIGLILGVFVVDEKEVGLLGNEMQHKMLADTAYLPSNVKSKTVSPDDLLQPVPTDLNIVLIGDSVTRYGYLSLVYFLRWGRWFEPTLERNNLVNEGSFNSLFYDNSHDFKEFYFQTSRMLQPYELCDCYKEKDSATPSHIENRYYYDPEKNNRVTFLHAYGSKGDHSIHGRIPATEAFIKDKWTWRKQGKMLLTEFDNAEWQFEDWSRFVTGYLGKLEPRPAHIVMNHLVHNDEDEPSSWTNPMGPDHPKASEQFIEALTTTFPDTMDPKTTIVWKQTPFHKGGAALPDDVTKSDNYMCDLLVPSQQNQACMYVDWTKYVKDELYWDDRHFFEPVYRAMNEEMLEHMGYLPAGYNKVRRAKFMDGYPDSPGKRKHKYPHEEKGDTADEDR